MSDLPNSTTSSGALVAAWNRAWICKQIANSAFSKTLQRAVGSSLEGLAGKITAGIVADERAHAPPLLAGKPNVGFDEVRRVAQSVLGHRLVLDYSARLEGWTPQRMVERLVETVPEVGRQLPQDVSV